MLAYHKGASEGEPTKYGNVAFYKTLPSTTKSRYIREIEAMQERQASLIPEIVRMAAVHVEPLARTVNADYTPGIRNYEAKIRIKPSRLGRGRHSTTGWYARGDGETEGQHSLAHEYGHGVHYALAYHNNIHGEGGGSTMVPTDHKLWDALSRELGVKSPQRDSSGAITYLSLSNWVFDNAKVLQYAVSEYGTKNPKELLADMWAEYSTKVTDRSGWQPGPVAKIYGEYARQRL